ncbi:MAG: site-specific integrase [Actinomycetia bacterium]|nr:site-specific integrase [Actinomycetes bacterium]
MADVARAGHLLRWASARKGKTYPVEILTPDEVRALAAQCSTTTSWGVRNRAVIVLLYRTGLRLSEALAVRVKDINFEIGSVTMLHGKGDRMRTVGIDPGATPHIEAWIERRRSLGLPGDAPLFCTLKGGPLAGNTLREMLNTLALRAGIEKRVHPHGFRDTHAYELMMEGVPMPIIQQQLGHASLATTDRYLAHIAPKQVIETMGRREWSP